MFSPWSAALDRAGCCAHAHAPMPIGEIGGSKAQGLLAGRGIARSAQAGSLARKMGDTLQDGAALPLRDAGGSAPSSCFSDKNARCAKHTVRSI